MKYILLLLVSLLLPISQADLLHCAQQGNVQCQLKLAQEYYDGSAGKYNPDQGVYWFSQASKAGSAEAQWSLAMIYLFGKGVPQSTVRAVALLKLSAAQGNIQANYILGLLYKNGDFGVVKDFQLARQYLGAACTKDKQEACTEYETLKE